MFTNKPISLLSQIASSKRLYIDLASKIECSKDNHEIDVLMGELYSIEEFWNKNNVKGIYYRPKQKNMSFFDIGILAGVFMFLFLGIFLFS
jgi:hypothetical protein